MARNIAPNKDAETRITNAFVFGSYSVFAFIVLHKFVFRLLASNNSDLEFVHSFTPMKDIGPLACDWMIFFFLTLHVIRLQMGVSFTLYDKSWQKARDRIEPAELRVKLIAREHAFRVMMLVLLGLFSYTLSVTSFWPVVWNLFLQLVWLIWWWYNNLKIARQNRDHMYDRWENYAIGFADVLFLLFVVLVIVFGAVEIEGNGSSGFRTWLSTWFGIILFGIIAIQSVVFLGEFLLAYAKNIWDGACDFMHAIFARTALTRAGSSCGQNRESV